MSPLEDRLKAVTDLLSKLHNETQTVSTEINEIGFHLDSIYINLRDSSVMGRREPITTLDNVSATVVDKATGATIGLDSTGGLS